MVTEFFRVCFRISFKINIKKSQTMVYIRNDELGALKRKLNGEERKNVERCRLLGVILSADRRKEREVKQRKHQMEKANTSLRCRKRRMKKYIKIWQFANIRLQDEERRNIHKNYIKGKTRKKWVRRQHRTKWMELVKRLSG